MSTSPSSARVGSDKFFLISSLILLAGVLIGFAPTFYLREQFEGAPLPWWLIVHGSVLTAWYVLLPLQASLIVSGRRGWHKRLGWFTAVVALLVVVTAPMVVWQSVPRGLAAGLSEMEVGFLVLVNLQRIPFFAAVVSLALWHRRNPQTHKRLMLLASLSNFAAASSRVGHLVGVHPLVSAVVYTVAFGLAMTLYDRRSLGRVHPVTKWGCWRWFSF